MRASMSSFQAGEYRRLARLIAPHMQIVAAAVVFIPLHPVLAVRLKDFQRLVAIRRNSTVCARAASNGMVTTNGLEMLGFDRPHDAWLS
jgi:hypothetical protein